MVAAEATRRRLAGRSGPQSPVPENVCVTGGPFYEGQWGELIFLVCRFRIPRTAFQRIALLLLIGAPSDSGAQAAIGKQDAQEWRVWGGWHRARTLNE